MYITREKLLKVFPRAKSLILDCIDNNHKAFDDAGVNTPIRLVHFFAQVGHESWGLTKLEELGNSDEFKGRGLIQLTGRDNYVWIGKLLGVALAQDPELVAESPYLLTTALEFWKRLELNTLADRDWPKKITRVINGGYNGLDSRMNYVRLLKQVLLN